MDISIKNAKDLIQNQALEQHRKYINFHSVTKPKRYIPKYITDADLFLEEIMEFFNNRDYAKDVKKIKASQNYLKYLAVNLGKEYKFVKF